MFDLPGKPPTAENKGPSLLANRLPASLIVMPFLFLTRHWRMSCAKLTQGSACWDEHNFGWEFSSVRKVSKHQLITKACTHISQWVKSGNSASTEAPKMKLTRREATAREARVSLQAAEAAATCRCQAGQQCPLGGQVHSFAATFSKMLESPEGCPQGSKPDSLGILQVHPR